MYIFVFYLFHFSFLASENALRVLVRQNGDFSENSYNSIFL